MYTRRSYPIWPMFKWTRYETYKFTFIITAWVAAYYFLEIYFIKIPWIPLGLIGTAVAFVIGFQNNASYGRIWEARKIWGGIVNTSRTFGIYTQDMLSNGHATSKFSEEEIQAEKKILIHRHIAWMTALRHAMRSPRLWETMMQEKSNRDWKIPTPEKTISLEDDLKPYLSEEDLKYVLSKNNKQTAVLYLQSKHLKKLKEKGMIWEFSFLEMEGVIQELFTLQGKSERIKNFPYPRQFATLNRYFMWLFILLLPPALAPQFAEIGTSIATQFPKIGDLFIWFSIPFYVAIAWVFHTMERIGRAGENPFEGTANDVPISTIARGIEIDLRQNLGESNEDIPGQLEEIYNIQF